MEKTLIELRQEMQSLVDSEVKLQDELSKVIHKKTDLVNRICAASMMATIDKQLEPLLEVKSLFKKNH